MPIRIVAFGLLFAAVAAGQVHRHGIFEHTFQASKTYENPVADVQVGVEFTGPGGVFHEVQAFWNGANSWVVRFSPDRTGAWSFESRCSDNRDRGLHRQGGTFRVSEYEGENPLYLHGPPKLSDNRRYITLGDGTPWLWLSDTGWNSALMSTEDEWKRYVDDRAQKGFTAIQFVMTQWRAGRADEAGNVAFTGEDQISIVPEFFRRMDAKFDGLNEQGLVAAPVLLWALTSIDRESPGETLSDEQASLLAGYMVARYGAHHVIWILGGDGDYRGEKATRWKKIGRAVFPPNRKRRLVSIHPRGMQDPWEEYRNERWLDLFTYQSGHGNNARKWRWNATAGPAVGWKLDPPHPVIDAEPNYEGHLDYHKREVITEAGVRRAAYYSLLSAPPAGVSYGAHGIWSWSRKLEPPLAHPKTGVAEPWHICLEYPGAEQMGVLRKLFDTIEWWKLRPDRSLLTEDVDDPEFLSYPMPARAEDGSIALIYLPNNPTGVLDLTSFNGAVKATWVDPRTGQRTTAGEWQPEKGVRWEPPFDGDWLLLLEQQ